MAGCCEVVAEGETSAAATTAVQVEPILKSRRRRMELQELQRLKYIPTHLQENNSINNRKRQRIEQLPCDCKYAVHSCYTTDPTPVSEQDEIELEPDLKDSKKGKCIDLNLELESEKIDDVAKFGLTSVCGRRRDMEDAVSIQPSFLGSTDCHFFGVFDGHGCSHVATRCKSRMHEIVKSELEKADLDEESWKFALSRSFSIMDAEAQKTSGLGVSNSSCRCELQLPQCDAVGSTAVVAIVSSEKIVVSNCGDSRAVLCRNGVAIPLSSDHKPDRPDELDRIERAGGRVIYWDGPRVLGVLAMSRAIGDNYLKPYVIPDPEVKLIDRHDDDECLIIASDGLWDVVSNETACGVARMCLKAHQAASTQTAATSAATASEGVGTGEGSSKGCMDASILLTKLALARHSSDNVSVVVVDLKKNKR